MKMILFEIVVTILNAVAATDAINECLGLEVETLCAVELTDNEGSKAEKELMF